MKLTRTLKILAMGIIFLMLVFLGIFMASPQLLVRAAGGNIPPTISEKILVSLSNDTTSWSDDTLYAINPNDGSGRIKIFDFHSEPISPTGQILAPRIITDGAKIYFHSQHAYNFSPARQNLFSYDVHSSGLSQITPSHANQENLDYPIPYGDRIYYRLAKQSVVWTDANYSITHTVYIPSTAGCNSPSEVKAFDVAPISGKLAIFDFHRDGCTDNVGIYITDADGNNKQFLFNMENISFWDEPSTAEIFWSPDESMIAFRGKYFGKHILGILDPADTSQLSVLQDTLSANPPSQAITLYGWDPSSQWLLFSTYTLDPSAHTLFKIGVNSSSTFNGTSLTTLLTNEPISGATWGNIAIEYQVFLPLVVR